MKFFLVLVAIDVVALVLRLLERPLVLVGPGEEAIDDPFAEPVEGEDQDRAEEDDARDDDDREVEH